MSRFNKINDLYFNSDGDFHLGDDGDLLETKAFNYRGFAQMVKTLVESTKGDWRNAPDVGASLIEFVGKPNTQEVATLIKNRLVNEFAKDAFLKANEFKIDIFPVSQNEIAILLMITPMGSRSKINLNFTFSLRENKVHLRNF